MRKSGLPIGLIFLLAALPVARAEIAEGDPPEAGSGIQRTVTGALVVGESGKLGRYEGGRLDLDQELGRRELQLTVRGSLGAVTEGDSGDSAGFGGFSAEGAAQIKDDGLRVFVEPGFLLFPGEGRTGLSVGLDQRFLRDRLELRLKGFVSHLDLGEQDGTERGWSAELKLRLGTHAGLGIEATLAALSEFEDSDGEGSGSGNRRALRAYGTIPLGEVIFVTGEAVVDRYEIRPDRAGEDGPTVDNRVRLTFGVGAGF